MFCEFYLYEEFLNWYYGNCLMLMLFGSFWDYEYFYLNKFLFLVFFVIVCGLKNYL